MRSMKKLSAILIALVLSAGSAYGQAWNGTTFRDGYPLNASDLNSALGALPLPGGSTAQGPLHMGGNLIDGLTSLGLAFNDTPPSTPGSGGLFYVDASNVLHFLSNHDDFPLAGACYNSSCGGNGGPHWWIWSGGQGFSFGDPNAGVSEFATLRAQKNVTGTGGSTIGNGIRSSVTKAGGVVAEEYLALEAYAASGQAVIVIADNPSSLAVGNAVYGPGIPNGATISAVTHNSPSSGQATVTLSSNLPVPLYVGQSVSTGVSPSTEPEWALASTCDTYSNSGGSGADCVGIFAANTKHVPNLTSGVFGADIIGSDVTGRSSSVSGAVTGMEIDFDASGPDNSCFWTSCGASYPFNMAAGNRKGLQVIPYSQGPSVDGATSFVSGVMVRAPGIAAPYDPITLTYGFLAMDINAPLAIMNAYATDGSPQGQTGLLTFAGTASFNVSTTASSGGNTMPFSAVPIQAGQYVTDQSGCVPTGTTVSSVATNQAVSSFTVTLSANLTCNVTTSDKVTFSNWYVDGWNATGYYSDAVANLTNTGASGVIKLGTTNSSGTIAQIVATANGSNKGQVQFDGGGDVILAPSTGGAVVTQALVRLNGYQVSTLPTCNGTTKGSVAYVTDFSGTPAYNAALTGGGSIVLKVFCNGSAWVQG